MLKAKYWAASVALYLFSYIATIGAAAAADLRMAPMLIVTIIPSLILMSLARARAQNSRRSEQWLTLRTSIPYGFVFAALKVVPFNLSAIF